MADEQTFRTILIAFSLLLFPVAIYHRVRSQSTGESLDRWQEGRFILFTLRPIGIATMLGLLAYMIDPDVDGVVVDAAARMAALGGRGPGHRWWGPVRVDVPQPW